MYLESGGRRFSERKSQEYTIVPFPEEQCRDAAFLKGGA